MSFSSKWLFTTISKRFFGLSPFNVFLALFSFSLQFVLFLVVLFNLRYLETFFFEELTILSRFRYVILLIVLLILVLGVVVVRLRKPEFLEHVAEIAFPSASAGFNLLMMAYIPGLHILACRAVVEYINLNKKRIMAYKLIKVFLIYFFPAIILCFFISFVLGVVSNVYIRYGVPIAFIFWFLRLIIDSFETYVVRNLEGLKELLNVNMIENLPEITHGQIPVSGIQISLTKKGIEAGLTQEDVPNIGLQFLVLTNLESHIEIQNTYLKKISVTLILCRVLIWGFIAYSAIKQIWG